MLKVFLLGIVCSEEPSASKQLVIEEAPFFWPRKELLALTGPLRFYLFAAIAASSSFFLLMIFCPKLS